MPGRDDPDDVALDQPLGQLGILDLLADRRAQARLDDLGQVRVERRMGEPGHRHGVGPLSREVSVRPEQGGGTLGVLAEHLVEVAHPEQQERIGIAGLQLAILLHHRCQRGHS